KVVGADVVLVNLRLTGARRAGLDRVADVGPGVEPSHHVQARRFDDVLERAACLDRKADRAAADRQARDSFRGVRGKEERGGRAGGRADEAGGSQGPPLDTTAA